MRVSRPSTGTILGAIALFIALGGTAFAAGATVVNIADPTTPANIAHVNSSGRLETAGSDSVTNTVSTELAAPSSYFHAVALGLNSAGNCYRVATPGTGKALIVRQLRINVFDNPSPSFSQFIYIYPNSTCTGDPVADVNPPSLGETTVPFDPGLGVPANSALGALVGGSLAVNLYIDGYSVPSSQVPANGVTATGPTAPQHRH